MKREYRNKAEEREKELAEKLEQSGLELSLAQYRSMAAYQTRQGRDNLSFKMIAEVACSWNNIHLCIKDNKSRDKRLRFFERVQRSDGVLLEVKPSLIKNAGLGVFVANWYPFCPPGAIFGYVGSKVKGPPFPEGDSVYINKRTRLQIERDHPVGLKHLYPANYINCPIRGNLSEEEYKDHLVEPSSTSQDMRVANCVIVGTTVRVIRRLEPGTELLVRYGAQYVLADSGDSNDDVSDNCSDSDNVS